MEIQQKQDRMNREIDTVGKFGKQKISEREWKVLQQYRNLCEENKLTIDILIQRLLAHEKGREKVD